MGYGLAALVNGRATSLAYRMLSSMQGSLGIGANLNHWTAEDFATAKRLIAAYHSVQRTIVRGDLYRLISPRNSSEMSATETVSGDKSQAVVFAFANCHEQRPWLSVAATTRPGSGCGIQTQLDRRQSLPGTPASASGAWWMHHGIQLDLRGDFQGAAFQLDRQR